MADHPDIVERLSELADEYAEAAWADGRDYIKTQDENYSRTTNDKRDALTAEITRLRAEAAELRSVMIAAAEEIQAHWPAHCDAEGYGPANIMRRLEDGIPSQYAYTAGDFERLRAEAEALRNALAELVACEQEREDISRRKQRRENSRWSNPEGARAITAQHQGWKVRKFRAWNCARAAIDATKGTT